MCISCFWDARKFVLSFSHKPRNLIKNNYLSLESGQKGNCENFPSHTGTRVELEPCLQIQCGVEIGGDTEKMLMRLCARVRWRHTHIKGVKTKWLGDFFAPESWRAKGEMRPQSARHVASAPDEWAGDSALNGVTRVNWENRKISKVERGLSLSARRGWRPSKPRCGVLTAAWKLDASAHDEAENVFACKKSLSVLEHVCGVVAIKDSHLLNFRFLQQQHRVECSVQLCTMSSKSQKKWRFYSSPKLNLKDHVNLFRFLINEDTKN